MPIHQVLDAREEEEGNAGQGEGEKMKEGEGKKGSRKWRGKSFFLTPRGVLK